MNKNRKNAKTSRSKKDLRKEVAQIVCYLHQGKRALGDRCIKDLKARSIDFDEKTQQDVLMFAAQVYFQYDYDPWHKITPEVQKAADRLLRDL
jgi:hypothetical protein